MATCCLFLAGKVEETPKKCKDLVKIAKQYLESRNLQKHSDMFTEESVKEIMIYERILLQTIKFDLQVDHPYGYLVKYAKSLKGNQEIIKSLVQSTWTLINDSYCTTLCLQWEPEIVTIALMYLSSKMSMLDLNEFVERNEQNEKTNWYDQFVEGLKLDIIESSSALFVIYVLFAWFYLKLKFVDICHEMLDLYTIIKIEQDMTQPK